MARGQPDYQSGSGAVASVQFDGSSIIGGLRGIQSVDGKGRIIFADDFRDGFASWGDVLGAGARVYLDHTHETIWRDPFSLVMNANGFATDFGVSKNIGVCIDGAYGVEIALKQIGNMNVTSLEIDKGNAAGRWLRAELKYYRTNKVWKLVTTLGAEVIVSDWSSIIGGINGWFTFKLVVDFVTGKYVKMLFGNQQIDLSAYSLYDVGATVAEYLSFTVNANSTGTVLGELGIGYVVVTGDEP